MGVLWGTEDVMGADSAPDDMRLASLNLSTELPGSPTVGGKRHLQDVGGPLHALHAEAGSEPTTRFQVLDEPGDRGTKTLLLDRAERSPVLIESRKPLVSRHLSERVKKRVACVEDGSFAGGDLLAGLTFPRLPRAGPEP